MVERWFRSLLVITNSPVFVEYPARPVEHLARYTGTPSLTRATLCIAREISIRSLSGAGPPPRRIWVDRQCPVSAAISRADILFRVVGRVRLAQASTRACR